MASATHHQMRSIIGLMVKPLRDMFLFRGRSTRTELVAWWFLFAIGDALVGIYTNRPSAAPALALAWSLFWSFPWLALLVRRLHDQGRSGLWALTLALPAIAFAAIMAMPGGGEGNLRLSVMIWEVRPPQTTAAAAWIAVFTLSTIGMFIASLLPAQIGTNRYGRDPRVSGDAE